MKITAALPTGVTALLFDAARRRRRLEAHLAERLEAAGYAEVILPILDYLEPYERFLTAGSRGELYRLIDREGELLALRADFTPMLARLLAPQLGGPAGLGLPLRLYYRGDVVRYQEERPGRQREFYQLGMELLGVDGEAAEREALELFLATLGTGIPADAGERPASVVLSFAGALDGLILAAGGDPAATVAAIHRRDRAGSARAAAALAQVAAHGVPDDPDELGPAAADRLRRLQALAAELGRRTPEIELSVDLAEFTHQVLDPTLLEAVGERAYYDGLIFRGYLGRHGVPVGGGGRYDRLFRQLGAEVPAVGFSVGVDRLAAAGDLLADRRSAPATSTGGAA